MKSAGYADPGAIVTAQLTDGGAQPVVLEAIDAKADGSGFFWATFNTPFQLGYHVLAQGRARRGHPSRRADRGEVGADRVSGRAPASADLTVEHQHRRSRSPLPG